MLTKFTLTIGSTVHELLEDCVENWDQVSFSLKRTDYSGVMRSFSREFVFCNDAYDLLMDEYLTNGFSASAVIAVYTITNRWTWEKQFEAPLDFSTIENEHGKLTINALDNTLASIIKAKKSTKYEFLVSGLNTERVTLHRMSIKSSALMNVAVNTGAHSYTDTSIGIVGLTKNENGSNIMSTIYMEVANQDNTNSFFMLCKEHGSSLSVRIHGLLRCWLSPLHFSLSASTTTPVQSMGLYTDDENNTFTLRATLINDNILQYNYHGSVVPAVVGGSLQHIYPNLDALKAAAASETLFNYKFGIVGTGAYGTSDYWNNNVVYEYVNGNWVNKGSAKDYYQDRQVDEGASVADTNLISGTHVRLAVTSTSSSQNAMLTIQYATLDMMWEDPTGAIVECDVVRPVTLAQALLNKMTSGVTVVIDADTDGVIQDTRLVAAETMRAIPFAKMYATFKDFSDWMSAVFGYTYKIEGNTLTFTHRSNVFTNSVSKVMDDVNWVKYHVNDSLIYADIEAGYAKKEYGEIDGRNEKNFMSYYSSPYTVTDNKLTLQSKFRADEYGIEFTLQKRDNETQDDKSDNDLFVLHIATIGDNTAYRPTQNDVYNPSVCVENNDGFIAAMGNGAAVLLTMTSSDGANELENITCSDALFSVGELEFSTDDTTLPANLHALVQLDHGGYRYKGYIKEAEARFGKINGVEYTLIVKEITAL